MSPFHVLTCHARLPLHAHAPAAVAAHCLIKASGARCAIVVGKLVILSYIWEHSRLAPESESRSYLQVTSYMTTTRHAPWQREDLAPQTWLPVPRR